MTEIEFDLIEERYMNRKRLILNIIVNKLGNLYYIDENKNIYKRFPFWNFWEEDNVGYISFREKNVLCLVIYEEYFEEIKKIFSDFNSEMIPKLIIEKKTGGDYY